VTGEITRERSGRRVRVVAAAVGVVVLIGAGAVFALRGKGSGGSDPSPRPTAGGTTSLSTSPTDSPSPTPSEALPPPLLPVDAESPTTAGAVAFFRYFWAIYNYGFASLDSAPLRRISASSCESCTRYAEGIDGSRAAGAVIAGGKVTVRTAVAAPGDAEVGLVVNALVDQQSASTVSADGSPGTTVPGKRGLRIDAAVRWRRGHWVMVGMDSKGDG